MCNQRRLVQMALVQFFVFGLQCHLFLCGMIDPHQAKSALGQVFLRAYSLFFLPFVALWCHKGCCSDWLCPPVNNAPWKSKITTYQHCYPQTSFETVYPLCRVFWKRSDLHCINHQLSVDGTPQQSTKNVFVDMAYIQLCGKKQNLSLLLGSSKSIAVQSRSLRTGQYQRGGGQD